MEWDLGKANSGRKLMDFFVGFKTPSAAATNKQDDQQLDIYTLIFIIF